LGVQAEVFHGIFVASHSFHRSVLCAAFGCHFQAANVTIICVQIFTLKDFNVVIYRSTSFLQTVALS